MAQFSLVVFVADAYLRVQIGWVTSCASAFDQTLFGRALTCIYRLTELGSMFRDGSCLVFIFTATCCHFHILIRVIVLALVLGDSVDFV